MSDTITIDCKAGRFIFYSDVIMSHAKLVRDTVMAQVVNPDRTLPRIRTGADAVNFVRGYCRGSHSETPFTFIPKSSGRR